MSTSSFQNAAPVAPGAAIQATDYDGKPILIEPLVQRLGGVVREASVPPFAPPVRLYTREPADDQRYADMGQLSLAQ